MKDKLVQYDIDLIRNHPYQPRKTYSHDSIRQLANSIQKNGLIQPIVLSSEHIPYRLVVGQRRLLAYRYLRDTVNKKKYQKIPAIIQSQSDSKKDTFKALTENLQREDLNIIDKAESFKTLIDCGFVSTHKEIANLLSISRQMVGNYISISEINEEAKTIIIKKNYSDILVLSKLRNVKNQKSIISQIINKKLERKEALRLISEKENMFAKPEIKLKKNKPIISGEWGKIEKNSRSINMRINPKKLNNETKELFEKLITLLEENSEVDL